MSIVFNKIKNGEIFTQNFNPFLHNNEIKFQNNKEIVVIYGPNGTGKTSLVNVFKDSDNTSIEYIYNDVLYKTGKDVFYIITDQNNRNIISGDTRDFFLGDNIRHEFELYDKIQAERKAILSDVSRCIKSEFGISAGNSRLIDIIPNEHLANFVKDCANNKSKGEKYTAENIVELVKSLNKHFVDDYSMEKCEYFKKDFADKRYIINQIEALINVDILSNNHVYDIEENMKAIEILEYFHKNKCIVCDTDIDWEKLLALKKSNKERTLNQMDDKIKDAIEKVISLISKQDPFQIKSILLSAVASGDSQKIKQLCDEFSKYKKIYSNILENSIIDIISKYRIVEYYSEYQSIINAQPDISDEDYLYIKEIISNSMTKKLKIERDSDKKLRIYVSNQEFLNKQRNELPLSTGEQNFLSLTFEFLKAKKSSCPIVVIDDPISSFDSIYKNKVVYAVVKILQHKKRIVLTHNIDFIRLLDAQYRRSFNLYILNNTDGEQNGFILLKNNEQSMLVSLENLLNTFRSAILQYVMDKELFLIAMIPFMRGYANIINNKKLVESLTQVMHGYKNDKVDIAKAYAELFDCDKSLLPKSYNVSVEDILNKSVSDVYIVDHEKYPLLDKTLRHSFSYLFLRLIVEKTLVKKYNINTINGLQLGQIISLAYPDESDTEQIRKRVLLTSRKTLINEFNHFEGNLSIFQPAIDITDKALEDEKKELLDFVESL